MTREIAVMRRPDEVSTCPNPCGVITLNSGNVRLDWCGQIGCGCEGEEEEDTERVGWCGV